MASKREPYVGPRPFEENDREVFFGRDHEVDELVSLISAHQAVLLYAQSGVGKTSLVKASLIPTLINQEHFEVLPPARVRSHDERTRTGKIDNIYVYNALGYLSGGALSASQRAKMTLADFLQLRKQPDGGFFSFLRRRPEAATSPEVPSQTVIIFDQFEEIFTVYPERFEDRQRFFEQVADALQADRVLRVVFAMREDYIAQLDPYVSALPEKLRTRFRLEPLRQDTALQAVIEPLRFRLPDGEFRERSFNGVQRSFESGVAEQLVANLQTIQVNTPSGDKELLGEFIDPVHLQIVCQTLWRKLHPEDRGITFEHLKQYADVSKALGDFYETCIASAAARGGIDQAKLRVLFASALITSSKRRGMIYRPNEATMVAGIPVAAIDEFENQHIIRAELRSDEPWYELSHDRFIQPILDSNRQWREKQPFAEQKRDELEARATEWIQSGKDRSLLLRGVEAETAKKWLTTSEAANVGYSNELYAFVTASQAAHEQRGARRMRLAFAGSVVAVLLMSFLTVFAITQRAKAENLNKQLLAQSQALRVQTDLATRKQRDAELARLEALQQRKEAELATAQAKRAKEEAVDLRRAAEAALGTVQKARDEARLQEGLAIQQKEIATSRAVAAVSTTKLEDDPELSAALALAAFRLSPTRQAEDSLRASLAEYSRMQLEFGDTSTVSALFSPDGKSVFTIGDEGVHSTDLTTKQTSIFPDAIALSPDGKFILAHPPRTDDTRSDDRLKLLLIEVGTRRVVSELRGHHGLPTMASFSPDGRFAITASNDDTVIVWDVQTGQNLALLRPRPREKAEGPADPEDVTDEKDFRTIKSISLSGDAKFALTITELQFSPAIVSLWDVRNGRVIAELPYGFGDRPDAAFSPDGKLVVTYGGNPARLWDTDTGREWHWPMGLGIEPGVLRGHTDTILNASFSPNSRFVVTASKDKTARVWDVMSGKVVSQMLGHTNTVNSASFSGDGESVVTASNDGTARVWRAATGEELGALRGHKGVVRTAAFGPHNDLVVTASDDNSGRRSIFQQAYSMAQYVVVNRKWIEQMYLAGDKMQQWVDEHPEAKTIDEIALGLEQVMNAMSDRELLKISKRLTRSTANSRIRVWEANKDQGVALFSGDSGSLVTTDFSPDGQLIVTAGDETALLFSTSTRERVAELQIGEHIYDAKFSRDGRLLVTAGGSDGEDGTAVIWDVATRKKLQVMRGHREEVLSASFSPDSRLIVTSGVDKTVRVWDVRTGKEIKTLRGHTDNVTRAVFSPDGQTILSSSWDQTARVWNWKAQPGQEVRFVLQGHADSLICAAFDPTGRVAATASLDGTARLWDVSTGRELKTLKHGISTNRTDREIGVLAVAFSPDGKFLVTSNVDRTAQIWDVSTGRNLATLRGHTGDVNEAVFSPDGRLVLTASADGTARIYPYETFAPVGQLLHIAETNKKVRELTTSEREEYLINSRF